MAYLNPPKIVERQSKDSLAITYNDASVLENFHVAEAFKIIYDDRTDILSGLTIDDMRIFRQFVIKVSPSPFKTKDTLCE